MDIAVDDFLMLFSGESVPFLENHNSMNLVRLDGNRIDT